MAHRAGGAVRQDFPRPPPIDAVLVAGARRGKGSERITVPRELTGTGLMQGRPAGHYLRLQFLTVQPMPDLAMQQYR